MGITVVKPQNQAVGAFDGGKITEQKPIGFPGEGSQIERLGPLFYWAWAKSTEPAEIGLHPHQGFEIISYVIEGRVYHRDTLGIESIVNTGGAQLMQTGSGVYHAEVFKEPSQMFQIWFEPHLSQAIQRKPTYALYEPHDFPMTDKKGVKVKTVLGKTSPMQIVADAAMWDVFIPSELEYTHHLSSNRALAGLAISGDGIISFDKESSAFEHKDFVIAQSGKDEEGEVTIKSLDKDLRIFLIEVPIQVDYPLYRKSG